MTIPHETISSVALEGTEPLPTAVVSDALDGLGLPVACLGWDIVPLRPTDHIMGRAFPVLQVEVDVAPQVPYEGLLAALDEIAAGEVFVIPNARSDSAAVWGELVSTACKTRGVAGAVTDGLVRDTQRIKALEFPVFARGTCPLDTNGRLEIVDTAVAATIDDVVIRRGDLIVADADGILIVPDAAIEEVIVRAQEKIRAEANFRSAVSEGATASDAFRRFGVL